MLQRNNLLFETPSTQFKTTIRTLPNAVIKQPKDTIEPHCWCFAKAPQSRRPLPQGSEGFTGPALKIRGPCQTESEARTKPSMSSAWFGPVLFLPVLQAKQGADTGHHRTGRAQKSHQPLTQPLPVMLAGLGLPASTSLLFAALMSCRKQRLNI